MKGWRNWRKPSAPWYFRARWKPTGRNFMASLRQTQALDRAVLHLEEMLKGEMEDPDLLSIDLKAAYGALGEITGETVEEDLLDTIFAEFCIGK
jgi:tRNA modification GTPase